MQHVSKVTNGVIKHRLFEEAIKVFVPLCCDAGDGQVVVLLAPTQSGKSMILPMVTKALTQAFVDQRPGAIPIVSLTIETVGDGRAKPKWLGLELLKALRHPIYQHIGSLDERDHYVPSRGRDEGSIRIALKEAFIARCVRRVVLDEGHLLTRSQNREFRGSILESVKSTCAIDRTLIVAGGYELAYNGLFDSPHFAGRVVTYDMGHYTSEIKDLVDAWTRILKTYSAHLDLNPKSLLVDEFSYLLEVTNGVVGLLDKMLWLAMIQARVSGSKIDKRILRASSPPTSERKVIALDIERGTDALSRQTNVIYSAANSEKTKAHKENQKPFVRSPNRNAAMQVEVDS